MKACCKREFTLINRWLTFPTCRDKKKRHTRLQDVKAEPWNLWNYKDVWSTILNGNRSDQSTPCLSKLKTGFSYRPVQVITVNCELHFPLSSFNLLKMPLHASSTVRRKSPDLTVWIVSSRACGIFTAKWAANITSAVCNNTSVVYHSAEMQRDVFHHDVLIDHLLWRRYYLRHDNGGRAIIQCRSVLQRR